MDDPCTGGGKCKRNKIFGFNVYKFKIRVTKLAMHVTTYNLLLIV